jgi:hypothetical protein
MKKVKVKLIGKDGNAFSIMGEVTKAMKKAGMDKEIINKYMEEAMSGDYNHLLATTAKYVDIR